jgi:hypothetical protein
MGIGWLPTRYHGKKVNNRGRHLKTTLKKTSTEFYVFIRGLRFGRCLSGVIVNCKTS